MENEKMKGLKKIKGKIKEANELPEGKKLPEFTSRVLFYTIYNYILGISLAIVLVVGTFDIFSGRKFFSSILSYILFLLLMAVFYFFYNWLYKCVSKTMLCITDKGVYREIYIPFYRIETTIPFEKITGVTSFKFFWIFRSVIIHQYGKLPITFFTWTAQEFKEKLDEKIIKENERIKNVAEDKGLINFKSKAIKVCMIIYASLVALLLLFCLIRSLGNPEKHMEGTYRNAYGDTIVLNKDETCEFNNAVNCTWIYDKDSNKLTLTYKAKFYSYVSSYESTKDLTFDEKTACLDYTYCK